MVTAGRTVVFSATTVALSMAVMVLFPMHFLKSFAYAGVATVAFAAAAALVVTPAALVLLGDRLDSLDVRRLVRRMLGRPEPVPVPVEQRFWYRWTKSVMRRAVPLGLAVVALLLSARRAVPRGAVGLPRRPRAAASASAHQVGDQLRDDFADNSDDRGHRRHSRRRRPSAPPRSTRTPPICRECPTSRRCPPRPARSSTAPRRTTVRTDRPGSRQRVPHRRQHRAAVLRRAPKPSSTACTRCPAPGGRDVDFTGTAQINRDSVDAITSRLPLVLGLIAVIMFVLLFLLTGSVVIPLKALVLNVLSLTAAFGAMVWIFQDGHLGGLGTTPTGTLGRQHPGAAVLHRVRPVDGLRGVPGLPHPRVLAGVRPDTRRQRRERGARASRAPAGSSPRPR